MRHLLNLFDLTRDEVLALLDQTARLKEEHRQGRRQLTLVGKVLGLIFEKPSMRTRVSFQTAIAQLGGSSVYLSGAEAGMGTRETVPDFARVMSQYVDGVVLRTFAQATVETFAAHSACPVINGLSDASHPCQALADLFTIREVFGNLAGRAGRTLVFVGDANNMARSLAIGCGLLGMRFILAAPEGYHFSDAFVRECRQRLPQARIEQTDSPATAVKHADIIYTDVWASMGQEAERETRQRVFASYQVNARLLSEAPAAARVMHCLPAHRGEEITGEVIEGERSIVFAQAGNRLHLQKALLEWLLQ